MTAEIWNPWTTDAFFLFMLRDDEPPVYLPCVGVESIEWPEEKIKQCEYCGAEHIGAVCSSCGNPAPGKTIHSLGEATATLIGKMPKAKSVFYLQPGATIDIVNRPCGPWDIYCEQNVVLRLANCKVIGRRLPNLCAWESGNRDVELYVSVKCEVELYPDGIEGLCTD